MLELTDELKNRLRMERDLSVPNEQCQEGKKYPFWVCQPYIRPPLVPNKRKCESMSKTMKEPSISVAKLILVVEKQKVVRTEPICACNSLGSSKCENSLCKRCCRRQANVCEHHSLTHMDDKIQL